MMALATSPSSRLLKKVPNFVLGSSQPSTYPRGYASGCDSPAASLVDLFEQPAESDCCGLAVELFEHSASLKCSQGNPRDLRACCFVMRPVLEEKPAVLIAGEF